MRTAEARPRLRLRSLGRAFDVRRGHFDKIIPQSHNIVSNKFNNKSCCHEQFKLNSFTFVDFSPAFSSKFLSVSLNVIEYI